MESLYFLIPLALVIIVAAVKLLFWAINNGQYDDLNTEGHRILFENSATPKTNKQPVAEGSPTLSAISNNTPSPSKKNTPSND